VSRNAVGCKFTRRDAPARRLRACERACGCERVRAPGVGVGVGVGWRPGALWRVEPRPLCRRRRRREQTSERASGRASERARERERERVTEGGRVRASPGGCVETPARTAVTPKSGPHPVCGTPTPTLAQSSRGDHRACPRASLL
jgi:hypothetical protein